MKVGDLVFAPQGDCMWPGKIIKINIIAEIKYFRIKQTERIPIGKLKIFDEQSIAKYQAENYGAAWLRAMKAAQKTWRSKQTKQVKQQCLTKQKQAFLGILKNVDPVKQEQLDNCKQEEEQNNQQMGICIDNLAQIQQTDLIQILSDSVQNAPKAYHFKNSIQNKTEKIEKRPLFFVPLILRSLFIYNLHTKQLALRAVYQAKIFKTICTNLINAKQCLSGSLIQLINANLQQVEYHKDLKEQKFHKLLLNFRTECVNNFANQLQDYTHVAKRAYFIRKMFPNNNNQAVTGQK